MDVSIGFRPDGRNKDQKNSPVISTESPDLVHHDQQSEGLVSTPFPEAEPRMASEKELRDSELRYRRLFETAQDAILILDGNTGEIIDANRFILDLLGYPLDFFIGRHLWELGFSKIRLLHNLHSTR